jgi:hypothetical protein
MKRHSLIILLLASLAMCCASEIDRYDHKHLTNNPLGSYKLHRRFEAGAMAAAPYAARSLWGEMWPAEPMFGTLGQSHAYWVRSCQTAYAAMLIMVAGVYAWQMVAGEALHSSDVLHIPRNRFDSRILFVDTALCPMLMLPGSIRRKRARARAPSSSSSRILQRCSGMSGKSYRRRHTRAKIARQYALARSSHDAGSSSQVSTPLMTRHAEHLTCCTLRASSKLSLLSPNKSEHTRGLC